MNWICTACRTSGRRTVQLQKLRRTFAVSSAAHGPLPKPRLDYKYVRDNAESVEKNCLDRNFAKAAPNVSKLVAFYDDFTEKTRGLNNMLRQRNELTDRIKMAPKDQKKELVQEASKLKAPIQAQEQALRDTEAQLLNTGLTLPNTTHPSAPLGPEENAVTVKILNASSKLETPNLKDHVTIVQDLDLVDFTAASRVSGGSWYYLKNAAVLLEQALINYSLQKAISKGFMPVRPPDVVRTEVAAACGFRPREGAADDQTYRVSHGSADSTVDLCLAGTAEIPLAGLEIDSIFPESSIPRRVVGVGRAFRAEAGAGGLDAKGLYRVHEFTKVELFAWTEPNASDAMLEEIRTLQEEIVSELGLHARVLDMPTHELGASAYRKYDIEAWMPSRGWGEVSSASNCTDYQARRLNTRYRTQDGLKFVHTLNGTAVAVPRMIIAILENGQTEDGRVRIPEVLRPFMGGAEFIEKR
ncbi:Serine--tRNA ligase, mitochondrial [Saitoella coloradoensis]